MPKRAFYLLLAVPLLALVFSVAAGVAYVAMPYLYSGTPELFWRGNPSSWSNFGTFMGGVAGPLAAIVSSLLAVLALTVTVDTHRTMREQSSISLYLAGVQRAHRQLDKALQQTVSLPFVSYQRMTVEEFLDRRAEWNKALEGQRLTALQPHLDAMNQGIAKLTESLFFLARTIGTFTHQYEHHAFSVSIEREECCRLLEALNQLDGLADNVGIKVGFAGSHLGLKLGYRNKVVERELEAQARDMGLLPE